MQSDLLDIIFENRNKNYGAYVLRRSYQKRMATAIAVTLFIAAAFSALQIIHHSKVIEQGIPVIIPDDHVLTRFDAPKPQPLPKPSHQSPASNLSQVIKSNPIIVDDNQKTDMPTTDDLIHNIIGLKKIVGNGDVDIIKPPTALSASKGGIITSVAAIKNDDVPVKFAEVMPEYPGGADALRNFMLKNLAQPDDLEEGEKIVVMASFIVNKTGQIESVKIIGSVLSDLDKEVIRVIKKMPLWKPGMQNGKPVSVFFNLPVTFLTVE